MKTEGTVEGYLVDNVLEELENEFSERICHMNLDDKISEISRLSQTNVQEERESIKNNIAKALMVSNQTQRIYFVVRSLIMTILGAIITLAIFWRLGTINVMEDFALGLSTYAICLVLSRLFDKEIVNVSEGIIAYLGEHTRLREFIVRNF